MFLVKRGDDQQGKHNANPATSDGQQQGQGNANPATRQLRMIRQDVLYV
jgi:hypothetical protein